MSVQRPGTQICIDAICIDQTNDLEKSHQVLQMGNIYTSARGVLVWLGKDDILQRWFAEMEGQRPASATTRNKNILMSRRTWFEGFNRLMLHRYWTRLWIIQELLLGRNTKLMAGSSSVSLSVFKMKYNKYRLEVRNTLDPNRRARVFPLLAQKFENKGTCKPNNLGVRAAFGLTAEALCQDPRDHILGLLSLVNGGEKFPLQYADTKFTVFLKAIVQFNDKYMSCAILELLKPTLESIRTDLMILLKSNENLSSSTITFRPLEEEKDLRNLCHPQLWQNMATTKDRYVWCLELLPKENWEDKYLTRSSSLHIIFEKNSQSGEFTSIDTICQRDVERRQSNPIAKEVANLVLNEAEKNVRRGALMAAKPLRATSIDLDGVDERVLLTFPLAVLSQFFWYLLEPQIDSNDVAQLIEVWDGLDMVKIGLEGETPVVVTHSGEISREQDQNLGKTKMARPPNLISKMRAYRSEKIMRMFGRSTSHSVGA